MKSILRKSLILVSLALCLRTGLAAGAPPRTVEEQIGAALKPAPPRTLEEKVNDADVIVRGKATLCGEENWVLDFVQTDKAFFGLGNNPLPDAPYLPYTLYQRKLQVDVTEVLWPPSLKGVTNLIFGCYLVKQWPPSWWAYTNTPGIFFLTKEPSPGKEPWTKLDRYDDWLEPTTNASLVQTAITRIRVRGEKPIRPPNGSATRTQPIPAETNRTSVAAGSGR
jgi:hypothetical protein